MTYEPYKDNLYVYKMYLRIKQNESFKNIFRFDLTKRIISDLRNITNPKHNFIENTIISLSGLTGSGKSIVSMSLGKICFRDFSYKNIMFYDQEIIDNASKFKPNTLIIRDENPMKAIFGQGSMRTAGQMITLTETCRKAGLNICFIEPTFQQNDITKIYLETIDMDIKRRITRLAVRDAFTLSYMGALYLPVIPETDKDWIKYNLRKDDFIEKMKRGDFTGAKVDYNALVKKIMDDEDFYKYKNKGERKAFVLSKYPNYTIGEINTILALIGVRLREEEE